MESKRLETGEAAPQFTLLADDASKVSLSDFAGQKTIVYFYPAASTPGCTKEACDFRDNLTVLNNVGYQILGISPDSVEKLKKFKEKEELNFPLLSDPDKAVATAYGAYGPKNLYGKLIQGIIRSTFVVDETQNIAVAQYNVKATGHVAKLIRDLKISE